MDVFAYQTTVSSVHNDGTTHTDVLTDFLNQLLAGSFQLASHNGSDIFTFGRKESRRDFVGKRDEVVITSNKVSLGVDFNHYAVAAIFRYTRNHYTFCGDTIGFLRRF
ncbi:hypothetical protein HORIV_07100 [Vreelandella olivaria]|uniref:Uncharacterized protein n=1 Tax=Vreelandella olivaria TaxID=390919 RepID=A0ABM7GCY4_9GAMM|nr:hypothetical protein HORIV_07100 [Halomonas olivaria]